MIKKQYLKIALVMLTSISPLAVVVACGKKDNKGKEVALVKAALTKTKTKFQNANSTKLKTAINLSSISKGDEVKTSEIGYEIPKNLGKGITAKYQLEKGWYINNNLEQFQIKVTLKKGNQEETQIITITAKTPTLQTEINKFVDQKSSMFKNKMENLPNVGQPVQVATIGYTPPKLSRGFSATYKIKKGWLKNKISKDGWITSATNIAKFEIEVIVKKDDNSKATEKKDVKITAQIDIFTPQLNKFKDADSSKTWKLITDSLKGKVKGDRISPIDIGYIEPTIDKGFERLYTLAENLDSATKKVEVKVVLKKYGDKSKEAKFQVSPTVINFTSEKNKFVSETSTESWKNIYNILIKNSAITKNTDISEIIGELGVTHKISDGFKATYKLAKDLDKDLRKIQIEASLEKDGDKSETTTFELSAQVFSFDTIKNSFKKPQTSTKVKTSLMKFLNDENLKKDDQITKTDLETIGFEEPNIEDNNIEILYTIKEINQTDGKIKIEVVLSKDGQKSEPISFEISPNIINFQRELDKFKTPTMSTKTETEINEKLQKVTIANLPSASIPQLIGYQQPKKLSSDFKPTFKLEKQTNSISLKITLEKDGEKSKEKTIEIQPNIYYPILRKFVNKDVKLESPYDIYDKLTDLPNHYKRFTHSRLYILGKEKDGPENFQKISKADLVKTGYIWPKGIDDDKTPELLVKKMSFPTSTDTKKGISIEIIAKLKNYKHNFKVSKWIADFDTQIASIPTEGFLTKTKEEILKAIRKMKGDLGLQISDLENSLGRFQLKGDIDGKVVAHESFPSMMGFNPPEIDEKYEVIKSAVVYTGDRNELWEFITHENKPKPELDKPFWFMYLQFSFKYGGSSFHDKYEPKAEVWTRWKTISHRDKKLYFIRWPLDTYHFLKFSKLQKEKSSKTMSEIIGLLNTQNTEGATLTKENLEKIINSAYKFPKISDLLTAKYTLVKQLDATTSKEIEFKVTLSKTVKVGETKTETYKSEETFKITAETKN